MRKIPHIFVILIIIVLLSSFIDLNNLFNYGNQTIPNYITLDNTYRNSITNEGATLGRVLFYDKKLSSNNTIACASCHLQERAFGDTAIQSVGVNGLTGRHSMRLINARFTIGENFFWDKRAANLEQQTTMPIQDHIEMGYSGTVGDQNINDLITLLGNTDYYPTLFNLAFGDTTITEEKIQFALAQFIRSIQSFDSKFDSGYAQSGNNYDSAFSNFTPLENQGKALFKSGFSPVSGGTGFQCIQCHKAPHFEIADLFSPSLGNNGIISVAGNPTGIDITNTRSPSLRDIFNPDGTLNAPLMHDGSITSLDQLLEHYKTVAPTSNNPNLDFVFQNGPVKMSSNEKLAITAFLKTLTGTDVYTNDKWSNPFNNDGTITINGTLGISNEHSPKNVAIYPNPVINDLNIQINEGHYILKVFSMEGKEVLSKKIKTNTTLNLSFLNKGIYILKIVEISSNKNYKTKFIKK